jgi:hypothetical protein
VIDHPRFTEAERGEPAIELTLEPATKHAFGKSTRQTLALSTQGAGLIVDELEYDEREEVAPVTVRVVLLTGAARVSAEDIDSVEVTQRLRVPDGGKHPTDEEIDHVAAFLQSAEIAEHARWLAEEVVAGSRLSTVMDPESIHTRRERMNELRGIAKDL